MTEIDSSDSESHCYPTTLFQPSAFKCSLMALGIKAMQTINMRASFIKYVFFKKTHQDPPFAMIDRQGKIVSSLSGVLVVLALTLANVNAGATPWL